MEVETDDKKSGSAITAVAIEPASHTLREGNQELEWVNQELEWVKQDLKRVNQDLTRVDSDIQRERNALNRLLTEATKATENGIQLACFTEKHEAQKTTLERLQRKEQELWDEKKGLRAEKQHLREQLAEMRRQRHTARFAPSSGVEEKKATGMNADTLADAVAHRVVSQFGARLDRLESVIEERKVELVTGFKEQLIRTRNASHVGPALSRHSQIVDSALHASSCALPVPARSTSRRKNLPTPSQLESVCRVLNIRFLQGRQWTASWVKGVQPVSLLGR